MPQFIEVNGEIVEFPDGMTAIQIENAINGQPEIPKVKPISGSLPRTLQGLGESALTMGTGALAAIPAGLGAAMSLDEGPDVAAQNFRDISENLTFQPRTREGEIFSGITSGMAEAVDRPFDLAGEFASDVTGSPGVGAAVKAASIGAPALVTGAPSGMGTRFGLGRGKLTNQQQVLQRAQAEGYVAPTSSANPQSAGRGFVEGVTGKPRLQQEASFRNQQVTNRIVADELGLPEGTVITREALDRVRERAGQAYEVLDNAGPINTTVTFRRDISKAVKDLKKASEDFPVLAKKESPVQTVIEMAEGLMKPNFDSSSVAATTRILRDEASSAFRNGQAQVGNAYRNLSKAIEDAAEAHLVKFGDPQAVQSFRDARQTIAKSYSVEKALDGDGFVSAPRLAAQLGKREPLSGGLRTIAEFAEQFPKSTRVIKERPIQTGIIPALAGAGGLGASFSNPLIGLPIAATAFGGPLTRSAMLSKLGQGTLGKPIPPVTGVNRAVGGLAASGAVAAPEQEQVEPTLTERDLELLRSRFKDTPFSIL